MNEHLGAKKVFDSIVSVGEEMEEARFDNSKSNFDIKPKF